MYGLTRRADLMESNHVITTHIIALDRRPDLWARVHRNTKLVSPGAQEEEEDDGDSDAASWQRPKDAWLCLVGEDGRRLWQVRACRVP